MAGVYIACFLPARVTRPSGHRIAFQVLNFKVICFRDMHRRRSFYYSAQKKQIKVQVGVIHRPTRPSGLHAVGKILASYPPPAVASRTGELTPRKLFRRLGYSPRVLRHDYPHNLTWLFQDSHVDNVCDEHGFGHIYALYAYAYYTRRRASNPSECWGGGSTGKPCRDCLSCLQSRISP